MGTECLKYWNSYKTKMINVCAHCTEKNKMLNEQMPAYDCFLCINEINGICTALRRICLLIKLDN